LALLEEQDIVYRELSAKQVSSGQPSAQPAPAEAQWSREITPDPVLLFRYSALTFNSHRIHYDRTYCTAVEGYPGLVVHGPLTATLLLEALREHLRDQAVTAFSFRAIAALYDTAPFRVEGRIDGSEAQVWAPNSEGNLGDDRDGDPQMNKVRVYLK
jgi:3-methylfumaryl-CoA hydratase